MWETDFFINSSKENFGSFPGIPSGIFWEIILEIFLVIPSENIPWTFDSRNFNHDSLRKYSWVSIRNTSFRKAFRIFFEECFLDIIPKFVKMLFQCLYYKVHQFPFCQLQGILPTYFQGFIRDFLGVCLRSSCRSSFSKSSKKYFRNSFRYSFVKSVADSFKKNSSEVS